MSLLEVFQLVGYSLGAVLPLWMGYLLLRQRLGLVSIERLLLALAVCIGAWHASNLLITLHNLLGLDSGGRAIALRLADTVAVINITACYSLLLHIHLHFWANTHSRRLKLSERIRLYLSYVPCVFLVLAVPRIWTESYRPMLVKLAPFVPWFVAWIAFALATVSITELLIARSASSKSERRILLTLAVSFIGIAILVVAALAFGFGEGGTLGLYLKTFANLGSLLPSALLAYYIYRYRYLELIIKESLIVATFAAAVLTIYLYGIRRLGEWSHARFGLRAGAIEAILILALVLIAAPLRGWLEKRFRALFERETALYREVVARIAAQAGQYRQLADLLQFVEAETASALSLGRVKIVLNNVEAGLIPADSALTDRPLRKAATNGAQTIEDKSDLRAHGSELAYPLSRENRQIGLMMVEAPPSALTSDVRAVLEVLAGQVAIAVEDCRLVEANVRLERRLAEGKRLAALGQMAATIAHEVKNPLSAIKSIAQVMAEDEQLGDQYARDLNLIVGETDRLSQSVTQLLEFASHEPPAATPARADELLRGVVELFRAEAGERKVSLECRAGLKVELDGVRTAAVRDALSNLLLNALQATPRASTVRIESFRDGNEIVFAVIDSGPGIPADAQTRIWEPFFTTRQRGTGLGLAIVRKRMGEAGGSARLARSGNGEGARFELRLPLGGRLT